MLTLQMALLACVAIPLAQAQFTYTYQGTRFTEEQAPRNPFRGQAITAELVTDGPIPADSKSPPDYSNSQPCPSTWTFTITVAGTIYDSKSAFRTTCYYLGNTGTGDPLLPAFLFFGLQQGDVSGGTEVYVCSHIHYRTFDPIACNAPFRDRNVDWIGKYGPRPSLSDRASAKPGKWSAPDPADAAAMLLKRILGMNIDDASLSGRVISVQKNIREGSRALACRDIRAAADSVRAQTGISAADAASLRTWLDYISAGIKCAAE